MAKISREYMEIIETLDLIRESPGVNEEQMKALKEAGDIIADYEAAVRQTAEMMRKYEKTSQVINRGMGFWQCPECNKRTTEGHSYCHWCGKALSWERRKKR